MIIITRLVVTPERSSPIAGDATCQYPGRRSSDMTNIKMRKGLIDEGSDLIFFKKFKHVSVKKKKRNINENKIKINVNTIE